MTTMPDSSILDHYKEFLMVALLANSQIDRHNPECITSLRSAAPLDVFHSYKQLIVSLLSYKSSVKQGSAFLQQLGSDLQAEQGGLKEQLALYSEGTLQEPINRLESKLQEVEQRFKTVASLVAEIDRKDPTGFHKRAKSTFQQEKAHWLNQRAKSSKKVPGFQKVRFHRRVKASLSRSLKLGDSLKRRVDNKL